MPTFTNTVRAFFAAYNKHDIEQMLAQCADDAEGRYVRYGRERVVPIRGGIDAIWRGFTQAVPDFRVEIAEIIPTPVNVAVVQAIIGGTMPVDVPGIVKKGEDAQFPHVYILRFNQNQKISYLDAYWDNVATSFLMPSAL